MTIRLSRRAFAAGAAAALGAPAIARAQAPIQFKYGNAGNAQTNSNRFNEKLFAELDKRTNGAIKTQIFAGTLGNEQQLIQGMALGTIDIYNGAYTGTREFDIFYSPGFFKDGEHAKRVIKSPVGQKASAVLEQKYQARLIGVGRLGPWVLSTKRKISSIDEVKGMKLRSPLIEGVTEAVKHLGAIPTPIGFTEIYLALQNGTVDGFVSALNPSVAGKFYEVSKFILTNPFGEGLDKEAISVRAWNRLSPQQQQILVQTFDEIEAVDYYKAGIDAITTDFDTWKKANGADTVVTLDQAALIKQMLPLNQKLANDVYGAGAWDQIQGM